MENLNEIKSNEEVRNFFKSRRFWKPFIAVLVGAVAGYLYYHFVGCTSGQCAITSNPFMSILMGGLLGYFVVSSPCSRGAC